MIGDPKKILSDGTVSTQPLGTPSSTTVSNNGVTTPSNSGANSSAVK